MILTAQGRVRDEMTNVFVDKEDDPPRVKVLRARARLILWLILPISGLGVYGSAFIDWFLVFTLPMLPGLIWLFIIERQIRREKKEV